MITNELVSEVLKARGKHMIDLYSIGGMEAMIKDSPEFDILRGNREFQHLIYQAGLVLSTAPTQTIEDAFFESYREFFLLGYLCRQEEERQEKVRAEIEWLNDLGKKE